MRGNRPHPGYVRGGMWSIPACAGEPSTLAVGLRQPQVYPRVCGGTKHATPGAGRSVGLSPRVRGNPSISRSLRYSSRSIPACAGEPIVFPPDHTDIRVYPRVCGGTQYSPVSASSPSGLSPRVRGNPGSTMGGLNVAGSIPACAGEPERAGPCCLTPAVYPRVCGGTLNPGPPPPPHPGLSPRVRGNPP